MRFFYSLAMLLFLFLAILHFAGCGGVEVDGEQVDGGQVDGGIVDGGHCSPMYGQFTDYSLCP